MDKKVIQINIPEESYTCIKDNLQKDESVEHWILTAIYEKLIANSEKSLH